MPSNSRDRLVPQVAAVARTNTHRAEIIECDATCYTIPEDVNVVYIANSFSGATLDAVATNVLASYTAAPRALFLVYFNPRFFDACSLHGRNARSEAKATAGAMESIVFTCTGTRGFERCSRRSDGSSALRSHPRFHRPRCWSPGHQT